VSGILESYSLWVAYRTLRQAHAKYQSKRAADGTGMTFWEYVKKAGDPTSVAVFMEDAAAVSGLLVAGGCGRAGRCGLVAGWLVQRLTGWLVGWVGAGWLRDGWFSG
jgi:hypothetical protein